MSKRRIEELQPTEATGIPVEQGGPTKLPCGSRKSANGKLYYFKRCEEPGCGGDKGTPATHNFSTEIRGMFCKTHAKAGMMDIKNRHKLCQKCHQRVANFNFPTEKKGICCQTCSEPGMTNVMSKKCIECLALKRTKPSQPCYNFGGEKVGLYCEEHKKPDMINVNSKKCIQCQKSQPNFNYHGLPPLYCAKCGKDKPGMVNVQTKMCIGCKVKYPSFNVKGASKPLYCRQCADASGQDMVDVKNQKKLCQKCHKTIGNFNVSGQKVGRFCFECKDPDMIDVVNKKCADCQVKIPTYNLPGSKIGLYCSTCGKKRPNMLDVVNPHCTTPECQMSATLGLPGRQPTKCSQHKESGMISYPRRKCNECSDFALYGMNSEPEYCEKHKAPTDFNLVQKACSNCSVMEIVDREGKCGRCSLYLKETMYLHKQKIVKNWLDKNLSDFKYESYDCIFEHGQCGKERPDFLWDAGTHKVVLEVDEDQHKGRPYECDETRMVNLTHAFGMPCIWIRFNPDSFKAGDGDNVSPRDIRRCDLLIRVLRDSMKDAPQTTADFCRVIHLFFDGFDMGQPIEVVPMKVD